MNKTHYLKTAVLWSFSTTIRILLRHLSRSNTTFCSSF